MSDPKESRELTRRRFLATTGLALAGGMALPRLGRADCPLSTADPLGPYHVADAPRRTVLVSADEPGQRLFITGRVLDPNCEPIANTIVDVWHATDAGCYSVLQTCPDEDPFNCRGQMLTDADGNYAFETILPGYYPGRPRHIHYLVSTPNGEPLITQLYFEGDPEIPGDPWASNPNAAARIIPLEEIDGALHGDFEMNLARDTSTAADDPQGLPTAVALLPNHPNPFNPQTTIPFQLRVAAPVRLALLDITGRVVRTLVDEIRSAGYHRAVWDGNDDAGRALASGVYLARLEAGAFTRVNKLQLIR